MERVELTAISMAGRKVKPSTAMAVMDVLSFLTALAILTLILLSCWAMTVNIYFSSSVFHSTQNGGEILLPQWLVLDTFSEDKVLDAVGS